MAGGDQMAAENANYEYARSSFNTFLSSLNTALYSKIDTTATSAPQAITFPATTGVATNFKDSTYIQLSDASLTELADLVRTNRRNLDATISFQSSPRNYQNNNDPNMLFNASFYTSILWTILAICILFYIFSRM